MFSATIFVNTLISFDCSIWLFSIVYLLSPISGQLDLIMLCCDLAVQVFLHLILQVFHFCCVVVFTNFRSKPPFLFWPSQLMLGRQNRSKQRLSLVLLLIVFPGSSVLDKFFSSSKPAQVVLILHGSVSITNPHQKEKVVGLKFLLNPH